MSLKRASENVKWPLSYSKSNSYFIISYQSNHSMCLETGYSIFSQFRWRRQKTRMSLTIILPKIQQIISDHIYTFHCFTCYLKLKRSWKSTHVSLKWVFIKTNCFENWNFPGFISIRPVCSIQYYASHEHILFIYKD